MNTIENSIYYRRISFKNRFIIDELYPEIDLISIVSAQIDKAASAAVQKSMFQETDQFHVEFDEMSFIPTTMIPT